MNDIQMLDGIRTGFDNPSIEANGVRLQDKDIPVIPTSPRTVRHNNFGNFIRDNAKRITGNGSSDLIEVIRNATNKSEVKKQNGKMSHHEDKSIFENFLGVRNILSENVKEIPVTISSDATEETPHNVLKEIANGNIIEKKAEAIVEARAETKAVTDEKAEAGVEAKAGAETKPKITTETVTKAKAETKTEEIAKDKKNETRERIVVVQKIQYSESAKINNIDRLIATLDIYKKKYPSIKIPEGYKDAKHDRLMIYVESAKMQINQRKKLIKYKLFLGGFFFLIEVCMIYGFGIDPEGFTIKQLKNMDQYELILNELQDVEIEREIEKWSPLTRIMWSVGQQLVVFMVAMLISKLFKISTPTQIQEMLMGFFNGKSAEDLDVEDGEEESLITKLYGIFKAFTSVKSKT